MTPAITLSVDQLTHSQLHTVVAMQTQARYLLQTCAIRLGMLHDLWYLDKAALFVRHLVEQGFPACTQTHVANGSIFSSHAQAAPQQPDSLAENHLAAYCTGVSGRRTLSSPTSARTAGGTPSTLTACSWSNLNTSSCQ